jgi:hypothetical protein
VLGWQAAALAERAIGQTSSEARDATIPAAGAR